MTFHYDELMTPGEVAHTMRVDPKTVSRWAAAGKFPYIKTPGGHLRVKRTVVNRLLLSQCPFCGSQEGLDHCDG